MKNRFIPVFLFLSLHSSGQDNIPFPELNIYSGSTHAHSIYSMSHGEHLQKTGEGKVMLVDSNYLNRPAPTVKLKPEWSRAQGQPEDHFKKAKNSGYDFYIVTDHSQEEAFFPSHPFNTAWIITQDQAKKISDDQFLGLVGYEHSENNDAVGKGHINVINSAAYINALEPGIDLKRLYAWLKEVPAYSDGPVVASFNHPGPKQYNNFSWRDDAVTDIITMLEVINSNKRIHYDGFISALDKGWKVSPVCGNDNHGLSGIDKFTSRTFVLSKSLAKKDILEAMKNRRTYAATEQNIQCRYTVNGQIMGSDVPKSNTYKFDIHISDPDNNIPEDKITKIDIIKDGGQLVEEHIPAPGHTIRWSPTIKDTNAKYFFVRVWNAGGGDLKDSDPKQPVAWLAPVWTGR